MLELGGLPVKVLCVLILGLTLVNTEECPPAEDIQPCTCREFISSLHVLCEDLQEELQLREAVAFFKGHKISVLEVKDSYLGDVPGYLFKDTHIKSLYFTFTKLTSLGDEENPPFTGLEKSLEYLKITEGFWDYDKPLTKPLRLSHLEKLSSLTLENNVIPKLGNDWFKEGPKNLKQLDIISSLVKEVGDKAFSSLENLISLTFTGNSVTLKRSALPEKSLYLEKIDIGENEIQVIPKDFFRDLPSLKSLLVDNNGLTSIPQETWKTIFPQLHTIDFSSNPLTCDSKLKWLFNPTIKKSIIGECARPETLTGREISSLKKEEMD